MNVEVTLTLAFLLVYESRQMKTSALLFYNRHDNMFLRLFYNPPRAYLLIGVDRLCFIQVDAKFRCQPDQTCTS